MEKKKRGTGGVIMSIYFEPDVLKALRQVAKDEKVSMSVVANEILARACSYRITKNKKHQEQPRLDMGNEGLI